MSCIEWGPATQKRVSCVCVYFDFIMLCRSVLFVTNASDMLSRREKHAAPTLLVHRFPKCVSLVVIRRSTPNLGGSLGCEPICAISYVHVVLVLTCLRACSRFGLDYRFGSAMWSWRRAACRAPLQELRFAVVVPCYAPSPRPAVCMDTGSPDEMLVKQKWTYQWLSTIFAPEQLPEHAREPTNTLDSLQAASKLAVPCKVMFRCPWQRKSDGPTGGSIQANCTEHVGCLTSHGLQYWFRGKWTKASVSGSCSALVYSLEYQTRGDHIGPSIPLRQDKRKPPGDNTLRSPP
jgi:hypothetical protein